MIKKAVFASLLVTAVFSADTHLMREIRTQWNSSHVARIEHLLKDARQKGIPLDPLKNKIYEGLAKDVAPRLIIDAVAGRKHDLEMIILHNKESKSSHIEQKLYMKEKSRGAQKRHFSEKNTPANNPRTKKKQPIPQMRNQESQRSKVLKKAEIKARKSEKSAEKLEKQKEKFEKIAERRREKIEKGAEKRRDIVEKRLERIEKKLDKMNRK
ncbi:MAG: hypothetical protein GF401_20430 [Chitinivibrionales bacterium]|nr:hypothetical protein [Chitinivibrionales bacterium]